MSNITDGGSVMSLFTYTYNNDGLRTRVDREDGSYILYDYDTLNRLTKEEKKNSGGMVQWRSRFYNDAVCNRTKWHKYVNSSTSTFTYSYNTLNQLTYFFDANASLHKYLTYDKNGNRVRVEAKSNGYLIYDYRYWWDQDDRLIKYEKRYSSGNLIKRVEYRYCRTCTGNRTERIEIDEYSEIIEWLRYEMEGLNHLRIDERYDSPSDGNAVLDDEDPFRVQRVYYNGPGQLGQIVKVKAWDYSGQNPTSTDYYYGYDILGNVSVISNSNGAEADQFEQDAFGNEVESSWGSPIGGITEHLTTKQYDADVGLYYFNAQWYEPILGAFLSRSPTPPDVEERYAFSGSNSIKYMDPTGENRRPLGVDKYDKAVAAEICYAETLSFEECKKPWCEGSLHDSRKRIINAAFARWKEGWFLRHRFAKKKEPYPPGNDAHSRAVRAYMDCQQAAEEVFSGDDRYLEDYTHFVILHFRNSFGGDDMDKYVPKNTVDDVDPWAKDCLYSLRCGGFRDTARESVEKTFVFFYCNVDQQLAAGGCK